MNQAPVMQSLIDNLASLPLLLPVLIIALTLGVSLVLTALLPQYQYYWLRTTAGAGLVLAWYFTYGLGKQQPTCNVIFLFNHLLVIDPVATYFHLLFISITLLMLLVVDPKAPCHPAVANSPEQVGMVLGVLLGACLLVMACHWLSIYLSLMLLSLSSAILVYSSLTPPGAEASLKYLLYSMATTAAMLWGISYLYAFTKTLALQDSMLAHHLQAVPWLNLLPVLLLALSSILFILAAVPFHFWIPDVYQGAAAEVIAYLATVPKLAAAGALLRIFHQFMPQLGTVLYGPMQNLLAFLALLTMLIGNAAAILQNNTQRMVAYATMAQGGLLLAGVVALPDGSTGVLYYSGVYGVTGFAALVGVKLLRQLTGGEQLQDYAGLGWQFPVLGICITVVMLALIGLPPTVGFMGKLLIFIGLWERVERTRDAVWVALFTGSLLSTVLSLYYYLKLPYAMFFGPVQHFKVVPCISRTHQAMMVLLASLLLWAFFNTHSLLQALHHWLAR